MGTARYAFSAVQLSNGKVLVGGGMGATGVLSSAELYDPLAGTWSPTGQMRMARGILHRSLAPGRQSPGGRWLHIGYRLLRRDRHRRDLRPGDR